MASGSEQTQAEPTVSSLLAKLDAIAAELKKAARLKRQYEFTIGALATTCALLLIRVLS